MEQRIDPNTKPEFAASTNPSFVPGLTGTPPSAAAPAQAPAGAGEKEPQEPEDAAPATDTASDATDADEVGDAPATDADEAAASGEHGAEAASDADADDGPVFEARDRRGSITANRDGIVFRLDDQEADFRWDEIGAVETTSPRFGRRFTVTVHTAANRWFNADVEADNRGRLKEWTAGLDAVLDAYFEE
ncbi:hypothetical protein [Streptomyces sp. t39]|uniref:hypothetical protein n=1 Tax=Streptomyces sp. t39 TaxID=1828156 RepID=UPI0011CD7B99|nr:hypothetical protein [Streptomyces sp. t39]TXS44009.1 hypothetical protein EAO77_35115 [Streptomyces sp. t39]